MFCEPEQSPDHKWLTSREATISPVYHNSFADGNIGIATLHVSGVRHTD
ncbi:MAG TPA: hypothetical protein PKL34_03935 [Candidatus Cloacimonadota bacterium]|nr:hypothetical protein [Candidatus Cloacimonadota bacterium]HOH60440.1 hypothetical protein [Candidatus Cloacimonadota bacterium]